MVVDRRPCTRARNAEDAAQEDTVKTGARHPYLGRDRHDGCMHRHRTSISPVSSLRPRAIVPAGSGGRDEGKAGSGGREEGKACASVARIRNLLSEAITETDGHS